jgi:replication factor A1
VPNDKLDIPPVVSTLTVSRVRSLAPLNVKYAIGSTEERQMNIRDLRDGMRRVDAEGEIAEISEPRTVNLRTGDQARVADCMLKDEGGQIKLSLWDDQIDQVRLGSKVRITNGYTNSFRGELRLNVGKYGKLEVL